MIITLIYVLDHSLPLKEKITMADYKKNKLRFPNVVSFSNKNKDSFNITGFGGAVQVAVWQKNNTSKGPVVKFTLPANAALLLKRTAKKLMELGPGNTLSFLKMGYDRDSSKYFPEVTISMGKDDKSIYFIEVTSNSIDGKTIKFPIWGTKAYIVTNEQGQQLDTPDQTSSIAFAAFVECLDKGYFDTMFTSYVDSKFYELNSGNSTGASSGSGSYSSSSSGSDDDDIPF